MILSRDDLDPRLFRPAPDHEQMALTAELGLPWPLNGQTFDWLATAAFAEHRAAFTPPELPTLVHMREALVALMDELRDLDASSPRRPSVEACLPYLKLLSRHILTAGADRIYRWAPNPFVKADCLQGINDALRARASGVVGLGWHAQVSAGWACIHAGLPHHALAIWAWLDSVTAGGRCAEVFASSPELPRASLTVLNGLAATHRLRGDVPGELTVRERIRDLWPSVPHYLGRNRIVESAIEAYRVDPTEERHAEALRLFSEHRCGEPHEPTECVRESLLVALMLVRFVLKAPLAVWAGEGTVASERRP